MHVVWVNRQDAKQVKTYLEDHSLLHKDYRMTPTDDNRVAIPVKSDCSNEGAIKDYIQGHGEQFCPFSSSVLGNRQRKHGDLMASQQALWNVGRQFVEGGQRDTIRERIRAFPISTCPNSFEFLGDDRNLVIPQGAFNPDGDPEFASWIVDDCGCKTVNDFLSKLWKELSELLNSPRVIRRAEVDPESGIRKSGYKILWPRTATEASGPGSPGWITITEQGIRQSFDLTRVMFSRGNISEKIRFGRLVCADEVVLDLYTGIGYFTLPALVHGKAKHVYCCEWNPDAIMALKYNLQDNGVQDKATILEGNCRLRGQECAGLVDRVSLGLIPSSEGSWRTAVNALRANTGGWLHVHANVPVKELTDWSRWVSMRLLDYAVQRENAASWVVVLAYIERVKSFAPTVNHYVADIWAGPHGLCSEAWKDMGLEPGTACLLTSSGVLEHCPTSIDPPSCALSEDGVLNQAWMRE